MYDAFEHPRAERPSCRCSGPRRPATTSAWSGARCSTSLDTVRFDPARALLDAGFVFGMVVQHEHQHDETMLATHQLRRGDAGLARHRPPPAPAAPVTPGRGAGPAGPFTMGTSTDPGRYDNERPAHLVDLPAFFIDTVPVSNAAYAAFIDAGGYDDERWWTPAGWRWRCERAAGPGVLVPRRRRVAAPPVRPRRAAARRRAGAARLLVRGGRVRPLGRPPAADRGRVGEGRLLGPATPTSRASRGATSRRRRAREPRPARYRPRRSARSPPARRRAACGSCSATCGSGPPRTSPATRASGPSPTGSTPRCSSATIQGAARRILGHRPAGLPHHVPQLGLPDPATDLRRLPHRTGRLTCAVTSPTSARHAPCSRCWSSRRTRSTSSPGRRARQRHGTVNADGFGVGWYADRDRARALPPGPADLDRRLLRLLGADDRHVLRGGGRPVRDGRLVGRRVRAPRRSRTAAGCSATTAGSRLADGPEGAAAPGRRRARRPGRCRLRAAVRPRRRPLAGRCVAGRGPGRTPRNPPLDHGGGRLTMLGAEGTAVAGVVLGEPMYVSPSPDGVLSPPNRTATGPGARSPTGPPYI